MNYVNGFPHPPASCWVQTMTGMPEENQKAANKKDQSIYFSKSPCKVTMTHHILNHHSFYQAIHLSLQVPVAALSLLVPSVVMTPCFDYLLGYYFTNPVVSLYPAHIL